MVEDPLKVQKEKSSNPQCFYLGDCYEYHWCSFVILPLSIENKLPCVWRSEYASMF